MLSVEFLIEAEKSAYNKKIQQYLSQLSDEDLIFLLPLLKKSLNESAKDMMQQKQAGNRIEGRPSDFIAYDDNNKVAKRYRESSSGLEIIDVQYKPNANASATMLPSQEVKQIVQNLEKPQATALSNAVTSELTNRKQGKTASTNTKNNPYRIKKILLKLLGTGLLGYLGYKTGNWAFDAPVVGASMGGLLGLGWGSTKGNDRYGSPTTPEEFNKSAKSWKVRMKNAYNKLPELIELNQWVEVSKNANIIKNGFARAVRYGYIVFPTPKKQEQSLKKLNSVLDVSIFGEIKVDPEDYAGGGTGALVGLALGGIGGAALGGVLGSGRRAAKLTKQEMARLNALQRTNMNRQDNKNAVIKKIKEFQPTFLELLELPSEQLG
jgi:hypothetical protein